MDKTSRFFSIEILKIHQNQRSIYLVFGQMIFDDVVDVVFSDLKIKT